MVPPLNRFSTQQILHTLGSSHHWALAVTAVVAALVVFGFGVAVTGSAYSRADDARANEDAA